MLRVKKFSWNPEEREAKVVYSIERDGGEERHVLECSDKPQPALIEAMEALEEDALAECEVIRVGDKKFRKNMDAVLGEGYAEREHDSILKAAGCPDAFATIRSVSWSWSHDIMGASVCLLIKLENSYAPLVVNTPHKPEQPYSEGGEAHLLPTAFADKLRELHRLVERYIDGDRFKEQTDLFEDAA
jgi:hypothetical protein